MSKREAHTPMELAALEHPTAETRDVKPDDQRLRAFGFTIHSRPGNGLNLWERHGDVYTEAEALFLVDREVKGCER